MEDPPVEREHRDQAESGEVPTDENRDQAESGEVPTDEKQDDDKPERSFGGEADVDGEESGLGEEEEESSESEEEEKEEVEPEQEDETKIQLRPCILEGGDAVAQQVRKYIIARKYVHVGKLIWDDELKYGRSRGVQRPRLARLRCSVAHRGLIEEVRGYLLERGVICPNQCSFCINPFTVDNESLSSCTDRFTIVSESLLSCGPYLQETSSWCLADNTCAPLSKNSGSH